MQFKVNGTPMLMTRLEFDEGGHILQLLIHRSPKGSEALFKHLDKAFRRSRPKGGVMSYKKPDTRGFREIRILEGLELPIIFEIMASGAGIVQTR